MSDEKLISSGGKGQTWVFTPIPKDSYDEKLLEMEQGGAEVSPAAMECLEKVGAITLLIVNYIVLLMRFLFDPMVACCIGFSGLFVQVFKVLCLDMIKYFANKVFKPTLHTCYEDCCFPVFVCVRNLLAGCNTCLEPLWELINNCVGPCVQLIGACRIVEVNSGGASHIEK